MANLTAYEELLTKIKAQFEATLGAWQDNAISGTKTPATRNFTLDDWNSLVTLLAQTRVFVEALHPVMQEYTKLGRNLDKDLSKAIDAEFAARIYANDAKDSASRADSRATQAKNSADNAKAAAEALSRLLADNDPEFIDNLYEVLAAFAGMGEDKTVLNLLVSKADLDALTALGDIVSQINIKPGTDTFEGYPAEFAVVQKDGENTGEDDGKSNYTNATHAAVFGNNNRIIATKGDNHNARNGFIGGGLGNKIYAENSFVGGGHENRVGNQEVNYDDSSIIGGSGNVIEADDAFIGGGNSNTVSKSRSAIVGGSGNVLDAPDSFIGAGTDNTLKGGAVFALGFRNYLRARGGATIGLDHNIGKTRTVLRVFAIGEGLQSETDDQTLLGKWNAYDTGAELIFGGGTNDTDRKNEYTLRKGGTPEKDTDLVPMWYVSRKKLIERIGIADATQAGLMSAEHAKILASYSSNGTDGLVYRLSEDGTYGIFTGVDRNASGQIENMVIGSTYLTLPVKEIINEHGTDHHGTLSSVIIPSTVEYIGIDAFYVCPNLSTVTFAKGSQLDYIDEEAFFQCPKLANVNLEECTRLTVINDFAFTGEADQEDEGYVYLSSLSSIKLPASVTHIGVGAFALQPLTTLILPSDSQLASLGEGAFTASALRTIVLPKTIEYISEECFYECPLEVVYYGGTESDWENIDFDGVDHPELFGATRYYYSATKPTVSNKYWRYVGNIPTVWEV